MLLAFQILMFIFIVLFGIGAIGDKDKNNRQLFTLITLSSIGALMITLIWG
ncbi:hypothetical protein J2S00_003061 [Caldalkalibacillus uzonensis]|uniref:Uncharacterized protein n=1 Tax=Caldalkalibacillus uzonensis TaxID=353224 RepID=A0ABU0CV15_9BACI|nr:hypothetical protein [Caldalkalibacillus uzonensis]